MYVKNRTKEFLHDSLVVLIIPALLQITTVSYRHPHKKANKKPTLLDSIHLVHAVGFTKTLKENFSFVHIKNKLVDFYTKSQYEK